MTSSDVVVYLRKLLKVKKVGHTGTLDPDAAGVLPICIGKATRISDFIMSEKKVYRFEMVLGYETDTCDISGNIIQKVDDFPPDISVQKVLDILNEFIGYIDQVPPMFSAIKIGGKKMYELARQGKQIDIPPRRVLIESFKVIDIPDNHIYLIEVECSKGTYIRSLCRDIGKKLNCGAVMSFLVRNKTGSFDINDSFTLDEIEALANSNRISEALIPVDKAISSVMPAIKVHATAFNRLLNGNTIRDNEIVGDLSDIGNEQDCRVYCDDKFIGIGYFDFSSRLLKIKKVLYEV